MAKISVTINTCDEVRHLRACVESVRPLADEIVVCDMESTDGSPELARKLGCKVITHPRMLSPHPEARTAAINAATGDWVLAFDPDMQLSRPTCERLREIAERDQADLVAFYCVNHYFGRRCRHGHGSQPAFKKFFKKACFSPRCTSSQTFFSESLSGRVLRLERKYAIEHFGYDSVRECTETYTRYAMWNAEKAFAAGIRPSIFRMVWRPVKRLLGNCLWRRGYLDGAPGLIVSVAVSWYLFMLEANLWDLCRMKRNKAELSRDE